jgi:hypothetical protein
VLPAERHGRQRTGVKRLEDGGPLLGTDEKPATAILADQTALSVDFQKYIGVLRNSRASVLLSRY